MYIYLDWLLYLTTSIFTGPVQFQRCLIIITGNLLSLLLSVSYRKPASFSLAVSVSVYWRRPIADSQLASIVLIIPLSLVSLLPLLIFLPRCWGNASLLLLPPCGYCNCMRFTYDFLPITLMCVWSVCFEAVDRILKEAGATVTAAPVVTTRS